METPATAESTARRALALTPAERQRGQRYIILSNLFGNTTTFVVSGAMMMLFANDVLHYAPKRIAAILALTPLIVLVRLPLLGTLRRVGLKRTLIGAMWIRLAVIVMLLAIPTTHLTFGIYLTLLLAFVGAQQLGTLGVWQPLLRQLTTSADRGTFFARMRFGFNSVTAIVNGLVALAIGAAITDHQYRMLLVLAALGICNQLYWIRFVPEEPEAPPSANEDEGLSVLAVIRRSPMFRRPLAVMILMGLCNLPIFIVYLRQVLHVPANLVAGYVLAVTIGSALSYLLWGKVADTVGFQPMLIGVLLLTILVNPLLLTVAPLPEAVADWRQLDGASLAMMGVLMVYGFFSGAFVAGAGIATTSIQHFHVQRSDSLIVMNLLNFVTVGVTAGMSVFSGWLLEDVVLPGDSLRLLDGLIAVDAIKLYLCVVSPLLMGIVIAILWRMPNARPYFGVGDFFTTIFSGPVRTIYAQRNVHHEDEERREELARWLGGQHNPMVIDPLLELLGDPDYDVRVEAIRGLAHTGAPLAGERLLALLDDERHEQLADHLAWALGELAHAPAYGSLVAHLAPECAPRVQAMAARALGKLGNPAAVPHLVKVLAAAPESLHLVSSCCRALLRLEAFDQAPLVFANLQRLSERDEYYELLNVLCDWLRIPSGWLLRATTEVSIAEMLNEEINRHAAPWQQAREPAIAAFRNRDQVAIRGLLRAHLPTAGPVVATLADAMDKLDRWHPLAVLATAWLLRQRPVHQP